MGEKENPVFAKRMCSSLRRVDKSDYRSKRESQEGVTEGEKKRLEWNGLNTMARIRKRVASTHESSRL